MRPKWPQAACSSRLRSATTARSWIPRRLAAAARRPRIVPRRPATSTGTDVADDGPQRLSVERLRCLVHRNDAFRRPSGAVLNTWAALLDRRRDCRRQACHMSLGNLEAVLRSRRDTASDEKARDHRDGERAQAERHGDADVPERARRIHSAHAYGEHDANDERAQDGPARHTHVLAEPSGPDVTRTRQ